MRRRGSRTAAAAVVAGLLLSLWAQPALAATVSGQVVMVTEEGELPSELQVMVLENPQEPQGQPSPADVNDDGSFSFEADESVDYAVGMFHESVAYSTLVPAGTTEPVELRIYETTDDSSSVRVASDSLTVVEGAEDGGNVLEVLQLLRVENPTDRTIVAAQDGESPRVLTLPVAEAAFDLAPAEQSNPAGLGNEGGEVVSTAPLRPGITSIRLAQPPSSWRNTQWPAVSIRRGLTNQAVPM